jgi:hypothetical protein
LAVLKTLDNRLFELVMIFGGESFFEYDFWLLLLLNFLLSKSRAYDLKYWIFRSAKKNLPNLKEHLGEGSKLVGCIELFLKVHLTQI